jgi:DNA ligase 1
MIPAYNIGKEKVFVEVARRCGQPVCVTAAKMALLKLQDWPWDLPFDEVFTCDVGATSIYVVGWNWIGEAWPFFRPNYANMEAFALSCASTASLYLL